MIVALGPPRSLPEPPGSAAALGSVVDALTSAGFAAGLAVHLLEPATVLSGWQGADATVAAAEVAAALGVAADLHDALTAAEARLADHHELWLVVAARVTELREDQRHRFATAGARLAGLLGPSADAGGTAPAEAVALVDAVAAEDAAAAAENGALLQALADDAAGAAAVLAAAVQPFGDGRAGGAAAVTAGLADRLPGWGETALAALGRQAGDELVRSGDAVSVTDAVGRWLPFAARAGFADALVGRLGPDGVTWLMSVLAGRPATEVDGPLATLLATALGSAGSVPGGRGAEVLDALRLDPRDPDGAVDGWAVAMGLVLAAPGAGATLAARWGGQLLAREAAQGARAGAAATGAAQIADPVASALAVLARSGDAAAAARFLTGPGAWTTLLSRPWPGGTADLAAVVDLAAEAPDAGRIARSVLLALGTGLAPGSSVGVVDDEMALAGVRGAVTELVAVAPGVLLPVLGAGVSDVRLDEGGDTALRGLGHLVADPVSADRITAAVRDALHEGAAGPAAGAVAGAHVAVLEYGQRLRYALDWGRAQSRAVDGQIVWTFAVSAPVALVPGPAGEVAAAVGGLLSDALDMNGDVEVGPDRGVVHTADDAVAFAADAVGHGADADARAGFDRVGGRLGRLAAPQQSLLDRLGDLPLSDLSHRPARGG